MITTIKTTICFALVAMLFVASVRALNEMMTVPAKDKNRLFRRIK